MNSRGGSWVAIIASRIGSEGKPARARRTAKAAPKTAARPVKRTAGKQETRPGGRTVARTVTADTAEAKPATASPAPEAPEAVIEQTVGTGVSYLLTDDTTFGLRFTSAQFRGFKRDGWFFTKTVFDDGGDENDRLGA